MITHVVLRPFDANGRTLEIGQGVDASQWKNTERLAAGGFLRLATPADRTKKPKASVAPAGASASRASKTFKIRKMKE